MQKSLVALDTDHIKEYVFGTNKLKEIRGASSLLDRLNRSEMQHEARKVGAVPIYMNGGSGLFLVDTYEAAKTFAQSMQQAYRSKTRGGASITCVIQELPEDENIPNDLDGIMKYDLGNILELMRYRLREAKDSPSSVIALASHPFMRPCQACGIEYAEEKDAREQEEPDALYCASCLKKRSEDYKVKDRIDWILPLVQKSENVPQEYLWDRILFYLNNAGYEIPEGTQRPNDFNEFRRFTEAKEYLGLIYADANGMGKKLDDLKYLASVKDFAEKVDDAVYKAMSIAIKQHLPVKKDVRLFPFDILLIGGDDIVMVTDAAKAMDVALTIAKEFHKLTNKQHALSVGVVLSPIKYPFGLLRELVESTLKFAKTEGAKKVQARQKSDYGDTLINFMTVTGSTSLDFKKVYGALMSKKVPVNANGHSQDAAFYATLRPYTPEQLEKLLNAVREGNRLALGRTKLHQVREAVLKKNLTTSVGEALAVLRNWRSRQREYVMQHIYTLGGMYQAAYKNEHNPASHFPRVTFPWFADGDKTYRTSLLDFVELYDFVAREEGVGDDEG